MAIKSVKAIVNGVTTNCHTLADTRKDRRRGRWQT